MNIISPPQEHWCHVDGLTHLPHDLQKKLAIPHGNQEGTFDSCHYYDLPWSNYSYDQLMQLNRSVIEETANEVTCDKWTFSQNVYTRTMLSEVSHKTKNILFTYC